MKKLLFVIIFSAGLGSFDCGPLTGVFDALDISIDVERDEYSASEFQTIPFQIRNDSENPIYYTHCYPQVLNEYDGEELVKTWRYPECACYCPVEALAASTIPKSAKIFEELIQDLNPDHHFRISVQGFFFDDELTEPIPTELLSSKAFRIVE